MASLSATWDLRCSSIPRSICSFAAPGTIQSHQQQQPNSSSSYDITSISRTYSTESSTSSLSLKYNSSSSIKKYSKNNAFDTAAIEAENTLSSNTNSIGGKYAIVFGTERGGLRYRVYPDSSKSSTKSNSALVAPILSSSQHNHKMVDLNGAVSGSITSIVQCTTTPSIFLLLVDDNRGPSQQQGTYAAYIISLQHSNFTRVAGVPTKLSLPRMCCAAFHPCTGFVYGAGNSIKSLELTQIHTLLFEPNQFPSIKYKASLSGNVRSNTNTMCIIQNGNMIICAVNTVFYGVSSANSISKIWSFTQSSQVHPALATYLDDNLIVASGRECISFSSNDLKPRNNATILTSAILSTTLIPSSQHCALLTFDGLCHVRHVSCLSVPFLVVELGNSPNNFFHISSLSKDKLLGISYSGEGRVIYFNSYSLQEEADRFLKLCMNTFLDKFPKLDVAESLRCSFAAANAATVGTTPNARDVLKQYLEMILSETQLFSFLVVATNMLCLLSCLDKNPSPANKYANATALKIQEHYQQLDINNTTMQAIKNVSDYTCQKLKEASASVDLLQSNASKKIKVFDYIEAAVWLYRSCQEHKKALILLKQEHFKFRKWSDIKYESFLASYLAELFSSSKENKDLVLSSPITTELGQANPTLLLSIFTSSHPRNERDWKNMNNFQQDPLFHPSYPLQILELLKNIQPFDQSSQKDAKNHELPLTSGRSLAVSYLESAIGISTHRPCFENEPFAMLPPDQDFDDRVMTLHDELLFLVLEGVILEQSPDSNNTEDSALGAVYRTKLRRLLSWPNAKYHSDKVLQALPSSFKREHAMLLGRLGKHEEALQILYVDLRSLELALEYCDERYERVKHEQNHNSDEKDSSSSRQTSSSTCVYLPLVKVALESDKESNQADNRGTKSAIQVLALRRSAIDRAAALRLLPDNLPLSDVARPFLIPALIDSESQVHRLSVASALLRAKYLSLKRALTDAQIRSQAVLHAIPALQNLNLGESIRTTKPFLIKPTHSVPSPSFPEVVLIKHFFPRHLVIQAKISNTSFDNRTLSDVAFVVADSSDDSILPTTYVPIKTLPPNTTGSSWCVLTASPLRLDGLAILTCEIRYTILSVDVATGVPLSFGAGKGRTFVEELQDVEVRSNEFEM